MHQMNIRIRNNSREKICNLEIEIARENVIIIVPVLREKSYYFLFILTFTYKAGAIYWIHLNHRVFR